MAKAVTLIETGDFHVTTVGDNLPNENEIHEEYGSKSFLFTGSSRAFSHATGNNVCLKSSPTRPRKSNATRNTAKTSRRPDDGVARNHWSRLGGAQPQTDSRGSRGVLPQGVSLPRWRRPAPISWRCGTSSIPNEGNWGWSPILKLARRCTTACGASGASLNFARVFQKGDTLKEDHRPRPAAHRQLHPG